MKKLTILSLFALVIGASLAQAQTPEPVGLKEAMETCQRGIFDEYINQCMRIASAAKYINPGAAKACSKNSTEYVPKCMRAIVDKEYYQSEVDNCANLTFDEGRTKCLENTGRPWAPAPVVTPPPFEPRPDTDGYILDQLHRIEMGIKRGRVTDALLDLGNLIRFIEDNMKRNHR